MENMSPAAMAAWDTLVAGWGEPLKINSAYRDPSHNAKVGGAKRSQHMHGNAFEGRGIRVRNAANGGGVRNGYDANAGWLSVLYLNGTGGPDLTRRIFPVVAVVSAEGYRRMPDEEVAAIADRVISARMERPDGPAASLT